MFDAVVSILVAAAYGANRGGVVFRKLFTYDVPRVKLYFFYKNINIWNRPLLLYHIYTVLCCPRIVKEETDLLEEDGLRNNAL